MAVWIRVDPVLIVFQSTENGRVRRLGFRVVRVRVLLAHVQPAPTTRHTENPTSCLYSPVKLIEWIKQRALTNRSVPLGPGAGSRNFANGIVPARKGNIKCSSCVVLVSILCFLRASEHREKLPRFLSAIPSGGKTLTYCLTTQCQFPLSFRWFSRKPLIGLEIEFNLNYLTATIHVVRATVRIICYVMETTCQ